MALRDAVNAHPDIGPYVSLPVGHGFTIAADGFEDVYEVDLEY